jgi:N-acetylmuramoyl-L-alanine amidase
MRSKIDGVLFAWVIAALLWSGLAAAGTTVQAVRVWTSPEYTRFTLEMSAAPVYKLFTLKNPDRVVIDLQGLEDNAALQNAASQVPAQNPVVSAIRVGPYQPGVTRMVIELKGEANPKDFTLAPIGEYGNRLVVDLYPAADKLAGNTENQVEKAIAEASKAPAAASEAAPQQDASSTSQQVAETAKPKPSAAADKTKKPAYIRLITVAVDAGHGGEDPGASGASGSHEKNITLDIARKLKERIDATGYMHAVLTRDGDYFVPLSERVAKARKAQADLFVSIHADSFPNSTARGSSVFALSEKGATSVAARWLAKHENSADLIGGVNIDVKDKYLKQTLIDLTQTATISDSLKLGRDVLDELSDVNNLHRGHVEQAGFAVLKAPDIPSILVETAFISNPQEEKRLLSDGYQDKLADAIVTGITRYFDKHPPLAGGKVARNM